MKNSRQLFKQKEQGETLVEVALTIGLFFFVLFTGMELTISMYRVLAVTHAAMKGARFATTKKFLPGETTMIGSLKQTIRSTAGIYSVDVPTNSIRVCPVGQCDSAKPDSLGTQGSFINLSVSVPVGSTMLGVSWDQQINMTFRNEGVFNFKVKDEKK